jgi:hypothetical protein
MVRGACPAHPHPLPPGWDVRFGAALDFGWVWTFALDPKKAETGY